MKMLFHKLPFIAIWMGFDLLSNIVLDVIPFLIGLFIAGKTGRKAYRSWLLCSLFAAVCFTVIYQFGGKIHTFDWIGFFAGVPATYLFFGLAIGCTMNGE